MNKIPILPALVAFTLLSPCLHAEDVPQPKGPVFCRVVPERKDDFAWENDVVAFRTYGPALKNSPEHENSGIDCWFKRTAEPIINKWYAGEQKGISYHQDHGEGYDGYHVGSSRGCGGTAIWQDGKMILPGVYVSQKVLSDDGKSCEFELTYHYPPPFDIDEVKHISLYKGGRVFRSESTFTKDGKPVQGLTVAVGVTTHDGRAKASFLGDRETLAMCWETIDGKGVGTGAYMKPDRVKGTQEIKSATPDESHAVLLTATDEKGRELHYAGFSWEGNGGSHTPAEWTIYLLQISGETRDIK